MPRADRSPLPVALSLLVALAACDSSREVSADVESRARETAEAAKQTAEAAKQTAAQARDSVSAARDSVSAARDSVAEKTAAARDSVSAARDSVAEKTAAARAWAGDLTDTGELSSTARGWLTAGSDAAKDGAAALVLRGEQVAPVTVSVARSLAEAYDSETVLEPVYQPIASPDDEPATGNAKADAAIQDMGRVELIDGLSVGFKDLTSTSTKARVTERGYLVLWRRGDHLVGFVYRSRSAIDIEKLIAEAPRLIGLVHEGIDEAPE
ncbi:MAG: hypothetical protein H6713_32005 [Myxococcales bacterium]|nr:hypothetical protein [Myxococcales bacterium]MCB9754584.1 hypothetical protein [Myxococcales bacterium]